MWRGGGRRSCQELPKTQDRPARAGAELLDRNFTRPFRAGDDTNGLWTINAGTVSAAGEALHRLPPTLALLWI